MSAIAKAEELFRKQFPSRLFVEQLALYLRYGFVYCAPDYFFMLKPIEQNGRREHIIDPSFHFERPNAIYVDLAVGKLSDLVRLCPVKPKFICFARKWKKQLRFYRWEKFRKKAITL